MNSPFCIWKEMFKLSHLWMPHPTWVQIFTRLTSFHLWITLFAYKGRFRLSIKTNHLIYGCPSYLRLEHSAVFSRFLHAWHAFIFGSSHLGSHLSWVRVTTKECSSVAESVYQNYKIFIRFDHDVLMNKGSMNFFILGH